MASSRLHPSAKEAPTYLDGDTLVMVLPSVVDLSVYTYLFKGTDGGKGYPVKQILLDCAAVKQLQDSGVAGLTLLGKLAHDHHVQLLFLDAPAILSRVLTLSLPCATWIESFRDAEPDPGLLGKNVA